MSDVEKVLSLGFLKLLAGPIQLDYENLALADQNYGVDTLFDTPLVMQYAEVRLDLEHEEDLKAAIALVTLVTVKWIEHNRIPGEIVLHYELCQLRWGVMVVCKAYGNTP